MSLKYYLRGLGIGVLITALILGITGKEESMTDAEIKIRAAQLGMVEETVLSDLKTSEATEEESKEQPAFTEEEASEMASHEIATEEENSTEETESEGEEEISEESSSEEAGSEETPSQNEESIPESSPQIIIGTNETIAPAVVITSNTAESPAVVTTEENYIIVTIESGSTCAAVSQKLYEAGIIESSEEYSEYLISNGYDRKLRAGEHRIPMGSSEEQIARIICKID